MQRGSTFRSTPTTWLLYYFPVEAMLLGDNTSGTWSLMEHATLFFAVEFIWITTKKQILHLYEIGGINKYSRAHSLWCCSKHMSMSHNYNL